MGLYTHGAKIGVIVSLSGGDEEVSKDIAMHVAASNQSVSIEKVYQKRWCHVKKNFQGTSCIVR